MFDLNIKYLGSVKLGLNIGMNYLDVVFWGGVRGEDLFLLKSLAK